MGNSYDERNPFEPRITDNYDHFDPITGERDRVGDENVRRKLLVASSLDQGSGILGNKRGTIFVHTSSSLVVYTDDGVYMSVTLS